MHQRGQAQWACQVGAKHNRQQLLQRAQHHLQHEADCDQVGESQCCRRPARCKNFGSGVQEQQAGKDGEQRRRQEIAQRRAKRRRVVIGQQGLHQYSVSVD